MPATSIAPQKGRAFLLKIGNGVSPPTYSTLTGLRASSLKLNGAPVDVSSKSSQEWRELAMGMGLKTVDFSGSGLVDGNQINAAAALTYIQNAFFNSQLLQAQVVTAFGERFTGYFAIASFERGGPHDNAETFSVELNSSGAVSYSPT